MPALTASLKCMIIKQQIQNKYRMTVQDLIPYKPGETGNPNGRPKGSRNRSTIVREWLECLKATDGQAGDKGDELARALIRKAEKGDVAAIKEAFDSAYGKIPDKVVHAETSSEELMQEDITQELLKHVPTEVLERIVNKEVSTPDAADNA